MKVPEVLRRELSQDPRQILLNLNKEEHSKLEDILRFLESSGFIKSSELKDQYKQQIAFYFEYKYWATTVRLLIE